MFAIVPTLATLGLSVACAGQEIWHGARFGMSRGELEKLFGAHLKPNGQWSYKLDGDEHICGADFEVKFNLTGPPKDGLVSVLLESRVDNWDEVVGKCVLDQFIVKLGRPVKVMDYTYPSGEKDYWFGNWFVKGGTVLYIGPKRIVIRYSRPTHALHPWYSSFP